MLSVRTPSVRDYFPYEPTQDQALLFQQLDIFLKDQLPGRKAFVLRGYAGTGKTTVVSALVQWLHQMGRKYTLMAPTGRAAKVMSTYSGVAASTIHKKIYRQTSGTPSQGLTFQRQPNRAQDTLFIVDEASMISDEKAFGQNGLLDDVINYVFEKPTNRLLLIGDTAQLPPVGQLLSPALDPELLQHRFRADVLSVELRQVMRQAEQSGILMNATVLREELREEQPHIQFFTKGYPDIFSMQGDKLEDGLRWAYKNFGHENSTIICRSNKNANQYNQYIRRILFEAEDEIESGDYLMVVRNNYYWLPKDSEIGFLANGDFVQVVKIIRRTEEFGFRFADARVRLVDYPDEPDIEVKLLLDTLHTDSPALSSDQNKALYDAVNEDYAHLETKKDRTAALRKDPFLNALQVKFAYALTCHKAQGGQWQAVFVDHGFLKEDMVNSEFARWLYTAVTRSSEKLFLLNFNPKLIGDAPTE
ncbi:UvrD-like helicase C-terminal domain-containing protein [Hymenobacter gelipurpurascens]|uniref:UvrD-like helicase C-terminal domain-containing protein n=1 Tax=Hymenobacter gelipurpurascens TaxID=89968 RepID=A0A212T1Z1_9BACT|nr:AAA family ATPase [Hymenobacter gelipurpurascens]SNC60035.1 UvrD-like helicase C-terminal domain-containing protein [Hymenobacter gelipurpurascens]